MKPLPWWFPMLAAVVFAVWMLDPPDVTTALGVLAILWWINRDDHRDDDPLRPA